MNKTVIELFICLLLAFLFRVAIPFDSVFTNPIQFNTEDAYYWLRVADQYPNLTWDYFINYPEGIKPTIMPLWSNMIAVFAQTFHITVSQSGAILPAIFGILTIIPVYVIGRLLFNRLVAFSSCLILSIMGGEFLARTQLGAADHHALEIFLLSMVMMFVIYIGKTYGENDHVHKQCSGKQFVYYIYSGIAIALLMTTYKETWGGWMLIPFILASFLIVWLLTKTKTIEQRTIIVSLVAICVAVTVILENNYINRLSSLWSWNLSNSIGEEMPLLFTTGVFNMDALWGNFGVTFYLALIGLGILGYRYFKKRDSADLFFIIWTLIIILITLSMRRFSYYLAINVALLSGYVVYLAYEYLKVKTNKKQVVLLMTALIIFISVPLIRQSVYTATSKENMMSQGWIDSIHWIKNEGSYFDYMSGKKSEYGVLSWWDYGYWIVRDGYIPVLCSPGQGDRELASKILTSNDDVWIKEQLKAKSLKYIMIDESMIKDKRYAIFKYAGNEYETRITYFNGRWTQETYNVTNHGRFMDRLWDNQVDYCKLVFQSNEVKIFEVIN